MYIMHIALYTFITLHYTCNILWCPPYNFIYERTKIILLVEKFAKINGKIIAQITHVGIHSEHGSAL